MIRDSLSVILKKREIASGVFDIWLSAGSGFIGEALPGRFVQVEVDPGPFPLIRRPFTISRTGTDRFSIVFEVRGRGTGILSSLPEGRDLRVLGPLGTGYLLRPGKWLLIGGGMGAAGFPCLASSVERPTVLLGASTEARLLRMEDADCTCITEDGSSGRSGLVTDLLREIDPDEFDNVALCGPVAMMKAVAAMLPDRLLRVTQVSAEARMGCGWGACEGCSIPAAAGGYIKCCSDGPVVPASAICWEKWEGI